MSRSGRAGPASPPEGTACRAWPCGGNFVTVTVAITSQTAVAPPLGLEPSLQPCVSESCGAVRPRGVTPVSPVTPSRVTAWSPRPLLPADLKRSRGDDRSSPGVGDAAHRKPGVPSRVGGPQRVPDRLRTAVPSALRQPGDSTGLRGCGHRGHRVAGAPSFPPPALSPPHRCPQCDMEATTAGGGTATPEASCPELPATPSQVSLSLCACKRKAGGPSSNPRRQKQRKRVWPSRVGLLCFPPRPLFWFGFGVFCSVIFRQG
jgi:hypothetical protein